MEQNQKLDRIEVSVASLMEKLQTLLPAEDGDELIPDTQKLKDLLSIDERIPCLEQMIENLSNFVCKLPSQLPPKTPGESRLITKKRKIKYVPDDVTNTEPLIYPRFYTIKLPAEQKRSISPYRLNILVQDGTGCAAKSITTSGRKNLNIQVTNDQQGQWLKNISSIDDIPCQINETTHLNRSRIIIYINEFNVENIE